MFQVPKIFEPKKIVGSKKVSVPEKFWVPRNLGPEKFWVTKNLCKLEPARYKLGPRLNQTKPNYPNHKGLSNFCESGLYAKFRTPMFYRSGISNVSGGWVGGPVVQAAFYSHFVAQLASQSLQDPGKVGFQVGPECGKNMSRSKLLRS